MTDEEYGRLWAEANGVSAVPWMGEWWCLAGVGDHFLRLLCAALCMKYKVGGEPVWSDASAAYAALGNAVRSVHRLVPQLADPPTVTGS